MDIKVMYDEETIDKRLKEMAEQIDKDYANEEISNLMNEAKNTNDENILYNNYNRIYDIYLEEAPYVGLYRETQSILYNNGFIGNIIPNSFNIFYTINQWYRQ